MLLVEDYEVHENIAENEEKPLPRRPRGEPIEAAKGARGVERFSLRARVPGVEGIEDVSFGLLESLSLVHVLDDLPSDANDVASRGILFSLGLAVIERSQGVVMMVHIQINLINENCWILIWFLSIYFGLWQFFLLFESGSDSVMKAGVCWFGL